MGKKVCVYGAAGTAIAPIFFETAEELGKKLAQNGLGVVFGGGNNGVMGAVARGVHSENGTLIGVTPRFFRVDGVLYQSCTELIYTDTMRERKKLLEDLSDAFIIAPGGIGTMDEFFEILTLLHLKQHSKPIIIFNVNGYYNKLLEFLTDGVEKKFISDDSLAYTVCTTADEVVKTILDAAAE